MPSFSLYPIATNIPVDILKQILADAIAYTKQLKQDERVTLAHNELQ
jgi:hypothetical protein